MAKKKEQLPKPIIVGEQKEEAVVTSAPKLQSPSITFEEWWAITKVKYNLQDMLKHALYIHFKAKGYLESKKFDEGLKDFGIT
jgi:hypothetical protein